VSTFEFEKYVKVKNLDIKWDIYWTMEDDGPEYAKALNDANQTLTNWAIVALERRDPEYFYKTAENLASLGAADSEPRGQFADLWSEAYGEDIY
jgi:hypothetical protein